MPPKKKEADKGKGKGKDGEVDLAVLMRKVKIEMGKVIAELQISPELEVDKFLNSKIQECMLSSSTKIIFSGDRSSQLPQHPLHGASHRPTSTSMFDVMALSRAMKQLTPTILNFKTVCFWKTTMGDEGLKETCSNVLQLPGLLNLEIIDCQVSTRGCEYLAQALRRDTVKLAYLSLDFNCIGDEGVTMLAEGLKYNKDLSTLSLGYCKIGPAGGCIIGDQVIKCATLKRLRLPGNRIMEPGIEAIARNLGKTTSLMELDVSDNSIGPGLNVLTALCEGLRTNASMQELNFEHNALSIEGAILLRDTLEMCANVKICKVSGQGIPSELFKDLCKDGKAKKGKKGKKGGKKKK
jgi:hypothetical protein